MRRAIVGLDGVQRDFLQTFLRGSPLGRAWRALPRKRAQVAGGLPAADVRRWETEDPPRVDHACDDCYTLLPEAQRPDDANHPPGDATLIDTLRRIVADRQYAKINGVLVDVWSASVTVLIWDWLRDDKRQRLLTLPSHELILRCVAIYTRLTKNGGGT